MNDPLERIASYCYNWQGSQYVLEKFGGDIFVRSQFPKVHERLMGTTKLSVNGTSATFGKRAVPSGEFFRSERPVLEDLLSNLEPTDVFWDVGADKGLYTCLSAKQLSSGTVVAFEPHPIRGGELFRNLKRNGLNVSIERIALSNDEGTADFGYEIAPTDGNSDLTVRTATGDSIIDAGSVLPPNVLKIDVEGAEYEVIEGLKSTLNRRDCRLVYCELHDIGNRGFEGSEEAVRSTLKELAFDVSSISTRIGDGWTQPFIKAEKH